MRSLHQWYPVCHRSVCAPSHHGYQRACDLISGQDLERAVWVTGVRMRGEAPSLEHLLFADSCSFGGWVLCEVESCLTTSVLLSRLGGHRSLSERQIRGALACLPDRVS